MKRSLYTKKYYPQQGFTLVELLVSVAVFAITMTIATGTLVVLVDANTRAQTLLTASSNLSFALDSMTRDIRTGRHYYCGTSGNVAVGLSGNNINDCTGGGDHFVFTDGNTGDRVGYRLNAGSGFSRVEKIVTSSGTWIPITSDEIFVTRFEFITRNTGNSDDSQPRTEIYLVGYMQDGLDTNTDFQIQTTVSQRILDIE